MTFLRCDEKKEKSVVFTNMYRLLKLQSFTSELRRVQCKSVRLNKAVLIKVAGDVTVYRKLKLDQRSKNGCERNLTEATVTEIKNK